MTAPNQPLRQRVIALAEKRNDTCAAFLAAHEDVSIAEIIYSSIYSKHPDDPWYRFTLPTGADLDWEPVDGWNGPSSAMDAMAEWVRLLEARMR